MGKEWDAGVPGATWALECLRVLKPGGHLITTNATRSYHVVAYTLDRAGFEIRDMVSWLQWEGMPKSLDVSKAIDDAAGKVRVDRRTSAPAGNKVLSPTVRVLDPGAPVTKEAVMWAGYGTGLKPAQEPAVLGRKPLENGLTVAKNVLKWGTGALNIDAARIPFGDKAWPGSSDQDGDGTGRWPGNVYHASKPSADEKSIDGHVTFCDCQASASEGQKAPTQVGTGTPPNKGTTACDAPELAASGSPTTSSGKKRTAKSRRGMTSTTSTGTSKTTGSRTSNSSRRRTISGSTVDVSAETESGGSRAPNAASSSLSTPSIGISASKGGRSTGDAGRVTSASSSAKNSCDVCGKPRAPKSDHPTVKPVALMRWLLTLVTQPGPITVLEPFAGSGTTLVAAKGLRVRVIAAEIDPHHCDIVVARVEKSIGRRAERPER